MRPRLITLNAALLGSVLLAPGAAWALPTCTDFSTNPAWGLAGNPNIINLASAIIPAAGTNLTRCEITFTDIGTPAAGPAGGYMVGQTATIGVRVGLPLSAADGGAGGVQGAWNGKVLSLGNGGFAGTVTGTTTATNLGYAGSGTDTGHGPGGGASFGLNPDSTINFGRIADYGYRGQRRANQWVRVLSKTYYGSAPTRNYWSGCSDGGREGHEMAQKFGAEFDGLLTNAPAIMWDRWGMAAGWPAYVANEELGAPLAAAKWRAVNEAAIAACDAIDGVTDGLIQDPRRCNYNASSFICTGGAGDPANCLTAAEASVVNKSWDGPRNSKGKKAWYGWERGTLTGGPSSNSPSQFGLSILQHWVKKDPTFDWHTVNQSEFFHELNAVEAVAHPYVGSDNPILNKLRDNGGKMLAVYGWADQVIPAGPRGQINYYQRVASQMGGIAATQQFYRLFLYPGQAHCSGGTGPAVNTNELLNVLVNWVENGVAPDHTVASQNLGGGNIRTRKQCMYPNTQVYSGSGSTDDHNNFTCQVNANDDPALLAADQVTKLFHAHE